MNLERISIKVVGRESVFMTLAKISDFSKLYTAILFDQDLTMQKINTGDSVLAFNFKNIEQFKGFRPFKPYKQEELLNLYKTYGTSFLYQTKLHSGDLVRYNGLKYLVLGIVVNTYAQWNMPTPLLFNPTNVNNDFKSLYGSRLTEEQINNKINDNFQAGKYDADMVIPLVDANDFSEYITVIEPRPTKEEVELMFDSVEAEKNLTIKSQKDVFIDTMLRLRGNEINKIKEVNEDLFKGVQTLLLSVNKAVNDQIELLPEPVIEKPARKPRAKKVVEELPKDKFLLMTIGYFGDKFKNTSDLYEHLKELLEKRITKGVFELPIYIEYSDDGDWSSRNINIKATNITPKGLEFNFETMSRTDFLEMLMIQFPEYDWATFDGYVEVEPVVKIDSDDLPDFIDRRIRLKDLPEPVKKLALFRQKQQNLPFNEDVTLLDDKAFRWVLTPESNEFWIKIEDEGDLREFKEKYGNKGEKVDDLIDFEDLTKFVETDFFPKEPVVEKQEVKKVEVIVYPPSGGVLNIITESLYELHDNTRFVLSKFKTKRRKLNFSVITDLGTYTSEIYADTDYSPDELLTALVYQFDTFVKPELNWKNFDERQGDIDRIKLNEEIINDSFKPEPKPVEVEKPKLVEVEKPKPKPIVREKPRPVPVEKPRPVLVEKPKPVPVEKPKPVKVEKPKVEKVVKQKVTKPKVEDDLSFLDDLDNIF